VGKALLFALLSESLALGGTGLLWLTLPWLLLPGLLLRLAREPWAWALSAAVHASLVLFLLVAHAAWGLALELGVRAAGDRADLSLGLRFGLYACGWDLITSPLGVLYLLRRASRRSTALAPLRDALRAPVPALNA